MTYSLPTDYLDDVIHAGQTKMDLPAGTMIVRAIMAGAILAIAAVFAISMSVQTGMPIVGAILFPVGFCLLTLFGFDLLTGVFVLAPLAWFSSQGSIRFSRVLRNWSFVFIGNLIGAIMVAILTAIIFTMGFTTDATPVGDVIAHIGEKRTIGYKEHGAGGMLTVFVRAMLCNWMVSMAVIGAYMSKSVSGKVLVMWMPIMLFFAMTFEHSIVNMYLFPTALILGGDFSIVDYLVWNEIPVVVGNLIGGLFLTALPLYMAHKVKTR